MQILVTGVAGFIGMHVARQLLARGDRVLGIDNLNGYYDPALKQARLAELAEQPGFSFERVDISDAAAVTKLFAQNSFDRVVHLAAQAGVRHSITHPHDYAQANLLGFLNIMEGCRASRIGHLVYASSSSVYGGNRKMPFAEDDAVDHPVSLYAASKKANELMAHSYSHLYRLPTTGLRFFSVYGPWGRPDMAIFVFTRAILAGRPIDVFNNGHMRRDFTYVEDIVRGVVRVLARTPEPDATWSGDCPDPGSSNAPYRIYNIGNNQSVELIEFIAILERSLGRKAIMNLLPLQPGDLPATYAFVDDLIADTGFRPSTPIDDGIARFVEWYKNYYNV